MGTSGVKYLPLERIETACPTGLDSPINVSEVQALGLKPGPGFKRPILSMKLSMRQIFESQNRV